MTMRRILMMSMLLAFASCGSDDGNRAADNATAANAAEASETRGTIAEALGDSADHSALVQALQSAGLTETLRGAGPYTLFAPSNAAFDAIPEEARRNLMSPAQRDRLIELLSYHIVPGTVTVQDLRRAVERGQGGRAELATVTGDNLSVFREGETIVISDGAEGRARITRGDQSQANGVVHSVDAVLMPGAGN